MLIIFLLIGFDLLVSISDVMNYYIGQYDRVAYSQISKKYYEEGQYELEDYQNDPEILYIMAHVYS